MAEIKWIKITTDIFDDEKIQLIESMPNADATIVIWFKLLALAGKTNNCGLLMLNDKIHYTDEMLATIFRRPLNDVRLALQTFEAFGMIEITDNVISIPNWEKHQNIDGMDKIREQTRKRVAEHRKKQKTLLLGSNENCNVTVTESNATDKEEEKDKDKDKNKDIKKEFETLWDLYPNKKGKDKALSYYLKARKQGTTYEDVEKGIKDYKAEIKFKKTEKQYIKHGSTWFYNKGWLDDYEIEKEKTQEVTGEYGDLAYIFNGGK